ncbi:hypothetical protein PPRFG01_0035400 [Plasmodium sp.]|nr:hypothetical protein PPRFG01_0035400 [Plasmodium sp.]
MHFKAFNDYDVAHTMLTSQSKMSVTYYMVIYPTNIHLLHISRSKKSPKSDIFHRGGGFSPLFLKILFFGPFLRRCLNPSPGVFTIYFFPFFTFPNTFMWFSNLVWGYTIPRGQKFYVPTILHIFIYQTKTIVRTKTIGNIMCHGSSKIGTFSTIITMHVNVIDTMLVLHCSLFQITSLLLHTSCTKRCVPLLLLSYFYLSTTSLLLTYHYFYHATFSSPLLYYKIVVVACNFTFIAHIYAPICSTTLLLLTYYYYYDINTSSITTSLLLLQLLRYYYLTTASLILTYCNYDINTNSTITYVLLLQRHQYYFYNNISTTFTRTSLLLLQRYDYY